MGPIAERVVLQVDETARRWLIRLGDSGAARAGEIALLRRLAFACLTGLVAVPAALMLVLPPALALPVGAALVLSAFLLVLAGVFAFARPAAQGRNAVPEAGAEETALELAAFRACPGLALILDPQGRVVRSGGRDAQSFPASLRRAGGEPLADSVHVSDRIGLVQALDRLRQGDAAAGAEIRVETPFSAAGRQFLPLNLDMTALRDPAGALVAIFAQARDMSSEEESRARAEAAEAHVAEARSAHEAKSRFLAAVSHELRTPLNAILGFSDVLAGEYFGRLENDRQREYVGLIRQSGAHLLSVVNTMLDMSKIEAGRYELLAEPFAVTEAIEACRAMLDLSARAKGVTLTTRAARGLGELVADRRALQQILINLAGNAIKFTDKGGVVSIDALRDGADLIISVSDTGIGIAAEKLQFIGQPFMQVENAYTRSYEGTGLGLSLVKGLVALHGGRFAIASRPGEGTVVTVALPADGSGIAGCDGTGETRDFPPCLRQRYPAMDEGDFADDRAQAKIA